MYAASTAYKNILKGSTSTNIAYVTLFDMDLSTDVDILAADIAQFEITASACQNEKVLGNIAQGQLKIEFIGDITAEFDLSHSYEIKPYVGVYLTSSTTEYVPYQKFIVSKFEYDQASNKTTITAYDYAIKFEKDFVDSNTYPISLYDFVSDLCDQAGVTLLNASIFNGTLLIATKPLFDSNSLKEVLSKALEIALSFAIIDRGNKPSIIRLSALKSQTYVETITKSIAREFSTGQDAFKTLGINILTLKLDNVVVGENVSANDSTMVATDGVVEMAIVSNPFIWNEALKTSVVVAMLAEIKGFIYHVYSCTSKVAPYLDLGDIIRYQTTIDEVDIISPMLSMHILFDGAIKVNVSTESMSLSDTAYKNDGSLTKRVKRAEIMVDKVNGEVSIIATDITDIGGRLELAEASIVVNAIDITSKVTASYVDGRIAEINTAKPNRVSNLATSFEQGTLTAGVPATSAYHIRTKAFYPINAGYVTVQCNDLYEAMVVIYSSTYAYVSSQSWSSLLTFSLAASQFFKVVLRSKTGNTVVFGDISTSELKVANEITATMWNMYYGDLSLEAQKELYVFTILSRNGLTFDGTATVILDALVLLDNIDITPLMASAQFMWTRESMNPTIDAQFNSLGMTGASLSVTTYYQDRSASFKCIFAITETLYLLTLTGNRILTLSTSSTLMAITSAGSSAIRLTTEIALVKDDKNLLDSHSTWIDQTAIDITHKVVDTDYNGIEIMSLVNQTADTYKIDAKNIQLEGLVTVNGTFKIDENGSMEATSGKIGGFKIGATTLESTDGLFKLDTTNKLINFGTVKLKNYGTTLYGVLANNILEVEAEATIFRMTGQATLVHVRGNLEIGESESGGGSISPAINNLTCDLGHEFNAFRNAFIDTLYLAFQGSYFSLNLRGDGVVTWY